MQGNQARLQAVWKWVTDSFPTMRTLVEAGLIGLAIAVGFMAYGELDARLDFALAIKAGDLKRVSEARAGCSDEQTAETVAQTTADTSNPSDLAIDKYRAQSLLDDLVMRGVACDNNGLDGIRKELGLPRTTEKPLLSWDLQSPVDGARWAFARTRSTMLLVYVTFLFSVVGTALQHARSADQPLLRLRPVVEGAILAVVLLILALSAPKLLYATEIGRALWLRPSAAVLLGFFGGAFRPAALVMVQKAVQKFAGQAVEHVADEPKR